MVAVPCSIGSIEGALRRRLLPQLRDAIQAIRLSPQDDPRPFIAVAVSTPEVMSPTAVARVTRTPSIRALVAFGQHLGPTPTFDDAGPAAAAQTIAAVMGNPESFTGFLVTEQAAAGSLCMSR